MVSACASGKREPFYVEHPLTRTQQLPVEAPPPIGRAERPLLPRITETTLRNGMLARVVSRPGTGLVSLVYANRRARLGADYLPVFLGDALLAGARRTDGQLVYPVATAGAFPQVRTGSSGTTITLTCTAHFFLEALELLASVVQRPVFDPTWMRPVRSQSQLDLLRMGALYSDWALAMWHSRKSFELDLEGVAGRLSGVDQQALRRAHYEFYAPEDSALLVAGDLSPAPALGAIEQHFSGWAQATADPRQAERSVPRTAAPAVGTAESDSEAPRTRRQIIVTEGDGYPSVSVIQDAPPVPSADDVAFELLSRLLTDDGSSNLLKTLRYEQGHAYYVRAHTITLPERGRYLFIDTSVAEETITSDVANVLRALRRLQSTPVDDRDLAGAKARFMAEIADSLSSGAGVAWYLAQVHLRATPALESIEARLDATTPEDIRRVAQRYLDPERATVGVAGKVSESLAALRELGEVTIP
jgi:zinc protease